LLLINYDRDYALKMLSLFGIQPQDYIGQLFFIDFNTEIESTKEEIQKWHFTRSID